MLIYAIFVWKNVVVYELFVLKSVIVFGCSLGKVYFCVRKKKFILC